MRTPSLRIGITERGDGGLDLSWENKLCTVDGAIIITKCPSNHALHEALLRHKDHLILHACITGNGSTIYEPHVKPYKESLNALQALIGKGFPANHIVLRCDPLIPTPDAMKNTENMLTDFLSRNMGINRVRISVLDNYPHIRERFAAAGLEPLYRGYFQPLPSVLTNIAIWLDNIFKNHDEITIESCAEPQLHTIADQLGVKPILQTGCCGMTEINLLGLSLPQDTPCNPQNRTGCLCLAAKTELLTHPAPCPHKCIYCYWKD